MDNIKTPSLDYKKAGVDINAGEALVQQIKPAVAATHTPGVMNQLGGFNALFSLNRDDYQHPVLVSATDGVGTKLRLAIEMRQHDSIGIDLVAMCANDIIVSGAKPLFFLDYYATGQLDVPTAASVIQGIAKGCEIAGAALIGGETAEMPGMYPSDDYDLAGFCVGIAEKSQLIDTHRVQVGDCLIAIASSGPHANGFSLIRKILQQQQQALTIPFANRTLGEVLLTPTRLYVKTILTLLDNIPVHSMAHITGGGITENLPRVLPPGVIAEIKQASWQWPAIFTWLQQQGNISTVEMYRTFNCGIGFIICLPSEYQQQAISLLEQQGETAWPLGSIVEQQEATCDRVRYQ